jgi:hypothetical protein
MAKWPCRTIKLHVMRGSKIYAQSHIFKMGQDNHTQNMAISDTTCRQNLQHYET